MKVFIGADHRGFELKEHIKKWLTEKGYEVEDCGNTSFDPHDDYPDFTAAVATKVQEAGKESRGIVICGSGIGVCITSNKFPGIRCALALNKEQTAHGRDSDNVNILALAADYTDGKKAEEMVDVFLRTSFSNKERHERRLQKIASFEK